MHLKIMKTIFCIGLISLTNAPFFFFFLFDGIRNIGINYDLLDSSTLSRMLLFGNTKFYDNVISGIVYAVLKLN